MYVAVYVLPNFSVWPFWHLFTHSIAFALIVSCVCIHWMCYTLACMYIGQKTICGNFASTSTIVLRVLLTRTITRDWQVAVSSFLLLVYAEIL